MQLDSEILEVTYTNKGDDLLSLNLNKPVLLVFLRHLGCTFCREAISDISKIKPEIIKLGYYPILIHMSTEDIADDIFKKNKLEDIAHISDPDLSLYDYFGLTKGTFGQLYGLKTLIRGIKAGIIDGHGGPVVKNEYGDYKQMPGLIIIKKNTLIAKFDYRTVADRPNYLEFIKAQIH